MIGWLKRKASGLVFGFIWNVIERAAETINAPPAPTRSTDEGVITTGVPSGSRLTQEGYAMIAKQPPAPEPEPERVPLRGGLEERLARHQLK